MDDEAIKGVAVVFRSEYESTRRTATRMVTLYSESDLSEYWELENKQTSSEISSARSFQIRVPIVLILSAAKKSRRIC